MKAEISNFNLLVKVRTHFAMFLFIVVAVLYYMLMLLVGLAPHFLGLKIGSNPVSIGILISLFVMVVCIASTGLYTWVANTFLDREFKEVLDRMKEEGLIDENGELKLDTKKGSE